MTSTPAQNSLAGPENAVLPPDLLLTLPHEQPIAAVTIPDETGRPIRSLVGYSQVFTRTEIAQFPPACSPCAHGLYTETPHARDRNDHFDAVAQQITQRNPPAGTHAGWVMAMPYAAGFIAEPTARCASPGQTQRQHAATLLHRLDAPAVFEHNTNRWNHQPRQASETPHQRHACTVQAVTPMWSRDGYIDACARTVAYTHAGDIFQANLSHQIRLDFSGSVRHLASVLWRTLGPACFAYAEDWDGGKFRRAVISLSPELFLQMSPGRDRLITRPIKGTRPGSASETDLRDASKDCAELTMITDLMRNDLGRIAQPGTVRVERARDLEHHHAGPADAGARRGGVLHAVSLISARVRDGVGLADVLRATVPAGSITGAPKVRAMQIIDELEPADRGWYCGTLGWIGDDGELSLNVAIRTLTVELDAGSTPHAGSGKITLPVGAGIVADSDPRAEWDETLDKARPILAALGCADALESGVFRG